MSTSTRNPYGWAIKLGGLDRPAAITAAAGANSDGDPGGASNLTEINANSQPGWTIGNNNTIYNADGSTTTGQPVPAGITGLIDPVATAPNIAVPATLAFGTVTVGASPSLNVTVQNTGTATLNVTGITITGTSEFTVVKARPFTVAAGGSTTIPVTYTPTAAGADRATLAIASDDPDTPSASVALSGGSVSSFVNLPSLLCVVGGTIGAVLICFPRRAIRRLPAVIRKGLRGDEPSPARLIDEIVELAYAARRDGLLDPTRQLFHGLSSRTGLPSHVKTDQSMDPQRQT